MKKNRILCGLMAVLLLLSALAVPCAAADEPSEKTAVPAGPPVINGDAAILIERNSGTTLYEQDADKMIYPASMTKVMTCLLALENGTLSDVVTVSETALADLFESGNISFLKAGEQITLENLLYCLMLPSANEAANAIAEYVSGNIPDFVQLMNKRAAELGCTGTHFANPHGLHEASHYTTVRDLSRITLKALENNTFRAICNTVSYTLPATNLSQPRTITTSNKLQLNSAGNEFYDKRVTGIKTGYTTPAGRCLVASAESGSISLLSVVCGCRTVILSTGDLLLESFPETEKLLNYGFDNFVYDTMLTTLYPVSEIRVLHSAGSDRVSLSPAEEIHSLMPTGYDAKLLSRDILLTADAVEAPISAGEALGTLTLYYDGKELGTVPLVAIAGVQRAGELLPESWSTASFRFRLLAVCAGAVLLVILAVLVFAIVHRIRRKKAEKPHRLPGRSERE